jgi:hypothetical protein
LHPKRLQIKNVLILLDPHESAAGGANFVNCEGKLIYAACNHAAHFKSDAAKRLNPYRYLSPWTREEFIVAHPEMNSEASLTEALERAEDVGMLPCYLIKQKCVYDQRMVLLRRELRDLAMYRNIAVSSALKGLGRTCNGGATTCAGATTIPDTLVSVYTEIQDPNDVDYDGLQGANYEERKLKFVSDSVVKSAVDVTLQRPLG